MLRNRVIRSLLGRDADWDVEASVVRAVAFVGPSRAVR